MYLYLTGLVVNCPSGSDPSHMIRTVGGRLAPRGVSVTTWTREAGATPRGACGTGERIRPGLSPQPVTAATIRPHANHRSKRSRDIAAPERVTALGSPDEEFPWQTAGRAAVAALE